MSDQDIHDLKLKLHRDFSAMLDKLDEGVAERVEDKAASENDQQPDPTLPADPVIYIAPDSNDTGILKALADKFKRGLKPGQTVTKDADGKRTMIVVTSNSYQDREAETITSAALQKDVDAHWTDGDDAYMSSNPLLYWHDDDAQLGEIVWGDMVGPFYVEVARELDSPISRVYFNYREAHPDEKWGASHRFAYRKQHRTDDGDYTHIQKRETTTLPLEAAANLLTISEVLPMSDKRAKKFDEIYGPGAHAILKEQGIDALNKWLADQGIDHKSTDAPDQPESVQVSAKVFEGVLTLIDDVTDMDARLDKALTDLKVAADATSEKDKALDGLIEDLNSKIKALDERLNAAPRIASQDRATVVSPDTLTDREKEATTEIKPMWAALQEGS